MNAVALLWLVLAAGPDAGQPSEAPTAPPAEVQAIVERMQGFYERTQDFTANFQQDYVHKSFGGRTVTSTGTVAFKKPAQMRWDYVTPSKRSFVLSGERVYVWDPQAKTLTRAAMPTSELSSSVTFLWGKGRLQDEFTIRKVPCPDCQGVLLLLTPKKSETRFRELRLELDPKTAQVRRTVVVDPDGSENAIRFSDLKTNTGVGKERFVLDVPEGTQVLEVGAQPHP